MAKRLTDRERLLRSISEASLHNTVTNIAEALGWWVWHDYDSRRNRGGFPDLFMIRPPRVVFAELKKENEQLRPDQVKVKALLERCPGVEIYLWRPSHLEELKRVLMARTPPQ
jgi:hypothetical protein